MRVYKKGNIDTLFKFLVEAENTICQLYNVLWFMQKMVPLNGATEANNWTTDKLLDNNLHV